MRTRRKLVDQGLPWLRKLCLAISCHSRIVGAMTAPTEDTPQPVAAWPAWSWWREPVDGHPRAAVGLLRVQAHNDMVLMARIRRAEGKCGMTRAEHLAWCKQRALEYADRGDVSQAIASMTSDLGKHPETEDHGGILLMTMMAMSGHLKTPGEVREFIDGLN